MSAPTAQATAHTAKVTATIRPMRPDEVGQVYRLGLECFDVQHEAYSHWSFAEAKRHVETCPSLCYVAEDAERVVGFALGNATFETLEDAGHLDWVAVASDHRGRGIGSGLVERLIEACRALNKALLAGDVSSDNTAFRRMMGKLGFQEGMTVTFFWKPIRQRSSAGVLPSAVPGDDGPGRRCEHHRDQRQGDVHRLEGGAPLVVADHVPDPGPPHVDGPHGEGP